MQHAKVTHKKTRSLIQLHELRVKRLEKKYLEKKQLYQQARGIVEERLASITRLKLSRLRGEQFLEQEDRAARQICHKLTGVHKRWVEYDLEKDEYYLEMEQQDMNDAAEALHTAKQAWLRSSTRKEEMGKQSVKQKSALKQHDEKKQEMELEETLLSRT